MLGSKKTKFNMRKIGIKRKFRGELEPQEIFLDALFKRKQKEIGVSEKKIEVPVSETILKILYCGFFVLILIFFVKTFYFQVIEGKKFSELSAENRFIISFVQAQRGVIYDKNGSQLVFNIPVFDLICDTRDLPKNKEEKEKVLSEIAEIIKKDIEILKKEIDSSDSRIITVSDNLSHSTIILLETKIKELPGFKVKNNTAREYKDGSVFSHIIGYQREDGNSTGLEKFYNQVLQQKQGEILVEKDALGNIKTKKIVSLPESGNDLVLWIDYELQKEISRALEKGIQRVGAKAGIGIAMDPQTGGILSLVSLPSYDNNLFSKGMSQEQWKNLSTDADNPLLNRVISGTYPSGSTIKPLIASAALQEELISPEKLIDCKGSIQIKNKLWPEIGPEFWKYPDWTIHGVTDIRKAIAESCNVFFYIIGGGYKDFEGLGVERIKKYLDFFAWGKKTNIDLPGEEKGFLPDPEWKQEYFSDPKKQVWGKGDTYNLSIGQGFILATPLQIAVSFGSIANGGILYEPHIVRKIVEQDNTEKEIIPKIIKKDFISADNLKIVRQGMRQAVSGKNSPQASACLLNSLPVAAAAKTGTAQTNKKEHYHNWVTVFAPYENPEIVLTIMIEYVPGGQVAVLPVAKEILEWYFNKES